MAQNKAVEIKLIKSHASSTDIQRANLVGLGLRRIGQVVVRIDSPSTRGMIRAISHMVEFKKATLGAVVVKQESVADFTITKKAVKVEKKIAAKAVAKKKVTKG